MRKIKTNPNFISLIISVITYQSQYLKLTQSPSSLLTFLIYDNKRGKLQKNFRSEQKIETFQWKYMTITSEYLVYSNCEYLRSQAVHSLRVLLKEPDSSNQCCSVLSKCRYSWLWLLHCSIQYCIPCVNTTTYTRTVYKVLYCTQQWNQDRLVEIPRNKRLDCLLKFSYLFFIFPRIDLQIRNTIASMVEHLYFKAKT